MDLSPEQKEFQKIARDFALREIAPWAKASEQCRSLPEGLLAKLAQVGLLHIRIPQSSGGLALTSLDACVIGEELARACSGVAAVILGSEIALTPLILCSNGSNNQNCPQENKSKALLTAINQSGCLLAISTDLAADLHGGRIQAHPEKGGYRLNGTCPSVLNASAADSVFGIATLFDSHDRDTPSTSIALSEPGVYKANIIGFYASTKSPGLDLEKRDQSLGLKAVDRSAIDMVDLWVDEANVFELPMHPEDFLDEVELINHPIMASLATGLGQAALDHACAYALERYAFGQPIANHQAVAFMLADMKKEVETSRYLNWRAALVSSIDGCGRPERSALSKSCRVYAQEMALGVATDAVQIFGGYGYSKEYPVEKLMRDAKSHDLLASRSLDLKAQLGRSLLAKFKHE